MLTLIKRTTPRRTRSPRGLFRCDCGNEVDALLTRVRCGLKTHCGCKGTLRRAAPRYDHHGEMLTIEEIVKRIQCPVTFKAVARRMRGGLALEEALTLPKHFEQKSRTHRLNA